MPETCKTLQLLVDAAGRREQRYLDLAKTAVGDAAHGAALLDLGTLCRQVHERLVDVGRCANRCSQCSWLVQSLTEPDLLRAVTLEHARSAPRGKGGVS